MDDSTCMVLALVIGISGAIAESRGWFDDLPDNAIRGPLVLATTEFLDRVGWGTDSDASKNHTDIDQGPENPQACGTTSEEPEDHVLPSGMPREHDTQPPLVLAYEHVTHEHVRVYHRLQRRGPDGRYERGWVLVEETEDD